MNASRFIFFMCLAFIASIFFSSFGILQFPPVFIFGAGFGGVALAVVFRGHQRVMIVGLCVFSAGLGVWRYQSAEFLALGNELALYNDTDTEIVLVGTVAEEPDIREKSVKLTIEDEEGRGRVLVTTWRYPEYKYRERLQARSALETPQEFDGFSYKDYLKKDGIYSVMYWPDIEKLEDGRGRSLVSGVYEKILAGKNAMRKSLHGNLSPPQSAILGAMILGDKRRISDDWKEKLNRAGVRHITAVSGLHVVVLTTVLMRILIGIGLWRRQAFYFTLVLIALFIIMTGFQSSAIRAGIMGGLFLLAQYLGRINVSSRAVVFAAAGMLALNPFLLRLDVGFQLSFLAVTGIIYLSPLFQHWFRRVPDVFQTRSVLAMTFSAYAFTAPMLIYNFGQVSLVGLAVNALVVPLLSFVMMGGFLFAFAGIIWQPLGQILSWPSWLMLTYITNVVEWFAQLPFAALSVENVHWLWLAAAYAIIGFLTWKVHQSQKLKFLEY